MSGTSLDGVDCVVARLSGTGAGLDIRQEAFFWQSYPASLHSLLMEASGADTFSVSGLSQLNVRLAHAYAETVRYTMQQVGQPVSDLDLVGSHGQTIRHVPEAVDCAGLQTTSTLQIGDPSVLANLLGVPVVGDFRLADMALGGQGAPLVSYFDWIRFAAEHETRVLLNLGGIANLTVLPQGGSADIVFGFDTGPGNLVIDSLTQRLFDLPYDDHGHLAASGIVADALLRRALSDPYFALSPPKSTGRERFGTGFARTFERWGGEASATSLIATATELTVRSVHSAYSEFVADTHPTDVLILSGGGRHNTYLVRRLSEVFHPVPVRITEDYGVSADAKEALCFAVLAHETFNRVPTSLPLVTGAKRTTLLGKICLPRT